MQLLQWRAASGDRAIRGGRLNLALSVAADEPLLAEPGLAEHECVPVPWEGATVQVMGPGFESEPASVAMTSPETARVAVHLDDRATVIVAALLERETVAPLQVVWAGTTRMRLPGVSVRASASRSEIVRRVSQSGAAASIEIVRSLIKANVRIEIDASDNAVLEEALREYVLDRLVELFADEQELVVTVGAADVVEWPIRLAATLDDLGDAGDRVQDIVLSEQELGRPTKLELRALGDFAGGLERVDVQIQQDDEVLDFALTDTAPQAAELDAGAVTWRSRERWRGLPSSPWNGWQTSESTSLLLVPVRSQATPTIEITAIGVAFSTRWRSIDVEVAPIAGAGALPLATLNAEQPTQLLDTDLTLGRAGYDVNLRYQSTTGLLVIRKVSLAPGENLLLVRDPYAEGSLNVVAIPTGNAWDDIAMAMVDMRYEDGDEVWEEALTLTSIDDFAEWEVPVRDDGPRRFQWRYHASYRDGRFEQGDWMQEENRLINVNLVAPERRQLQILPVFLEDGESVDIHVRMNGDMREVTLSARDPHSMQIPAGPYEWQAVWHLASGDSVQGPTLRGERDVIVVPRSTD